MSVELEKLYMPKSKIILPFKIFIYILAIISLLISFYRINFIVKTSSYNGEETTIEGTVIDYKKTSDKLTMTILTKNQNKSEKIIANYYYSNNLQTSSKPSSKLNLDIKIGDNVLLKGTLNQPLNNTIPNTFNYKKYLYYKEIYYLFTIKEIVSVNPSPNLFFKLQNFTYERTMRIDDKGYLTMLIYGKKLIDQDIYSSLQELGVIHLFAISGLHISIFTLILEKLLARLKINHAFQTIIIFLFLFTYAALINFPSSVLRALVMYVFLKIFTFLSKKIKINIQTYEVLLLSISFLLLINPYLLYDIGFLYSSLCAFGLIYYNDKTKNYILKSLKTTYIACLWSLPISISLNYSYNLLSPFFNLFFVPFISFIFYPVCLLTFVFPFILSILKFLIFLLEGFTVIFSKLSINIILPKMNIIVIIIYYLNIFLLSKYKSKYYHFLNLLILYLYPWQYDLSNNLKVYYLDVSQGDASVIVSPRKKEVVMIDTGGLTTDTNYYTAQNIIKFFHSINIKKVDTLIISHGDYDHIGNAFYLIDNIKIKEIIFNNNEFNELESNLIKIAQTKKVNVKKGKENTQGKLLNFQFLNTLTYDNENDNSLVTYLKYQNYSFLFMGDASIKVEDNLIKKYMFGQVDFLKVGHHGSKTSTSLAFVNMINPKYALISVGRKNKYGHPNKEALENLKNSIIYRTDILGTLEFTIVDDKVTVKNYSP